jgi:dihydrofolate reductase
MPLVSLVAALARNRVIGAGNRLPWRLPADLQRFKRLTMGAPVIMGRKTHESIGRALPGRRNIVVTRRPGASWDGCEVAGSLDAALAAARAAPEVFVIGGAERHRFLHRTDSAKGGIAHYIYRARTGFGACPQLEGPFSRLARL